VAKITIKLLWSFNVYKISVTNDRDQFYVCLHGYLYLISQVQWLVTVVWR
jgi:hypothetical protein